MKVYAQQNNLARFIPRNVRVNPATFGPHITEITLDLKRYPSIRYRNALPEQIMTEVVTQLDINEAVSLLGNSFDDRNRTGIPDSLHRVSAIRNTFGDIVGLTYRIAHTGEDIEPLHHIDRLVRLKESVLFVGPPGSGKTTALRDISRILADDYCQRVLIVDKSSEIAGWGDTPHACVGINARRMHVLHTQASTMIEAVENHLPDVVIVDELSCMEEALACRSIAQRGVRLIATAHGTDLASVLKNPGLRDVLGGIEAVTLGDIEARARGKQNKTVQERIEAPAFGYMYELTSHRLLHVADEVDAYLK